MPLLSMVFAALIAVLLLATVHWACQQLTHGAMGLLWRYVVGTACVGAVYGGWSLLQAGSLPAWVGFVAWAGITAGAGLGTIGGHAVDHWAGRERELRVLRSQVQDEQGSSRAAVG